MVRSFLAGRKSAQRSQATKTTRGACMERLEDRTLMAAFSGAVGFGASATGGAGGSTYHVTNLNDSGAGSFRDAVSHANRTIVFDVTGTISLRSVVACSSNLTINGQSAPGNGIAIIGKEVSFSGSSNDIVRYIRIRQGTNDTQTGKSAVGMDNASRIIFDHVSVEFGQWDNIDVNGSTNITFQNCIIADPIGQQFNVHSTSSNVTFYNDIFANAHNRSPLAKGNTQFINNVIYNFQAGYTAGDSSGHFTHDIVGNYFIVGPSTSNSRDASYQMGNQSVYSKGNMEDTSKDGRLNGGNFTPSGTRLSAPWAPSTNTIHTLSAAAAYAFDVGNAGDSLHRDQVDALVIADVTSLGKKGHMWTSQNATGLSNNGYGPV